MKNIRVLPTDKSSILSIEDGILILHRPQWRKGTQNIYITSHNEDINENDYIITKDGRLVQVSYLLSKDLEEASKVILTTDQDLIADGVQAIDDEFIEWFVKNPCCEEVEVESKVIKDGVWTDLKGYVELPTIHSIIHKIIIPQEEPKQETLEELSNEYAIGKSSAEVFRNAHKRDFIAGFKACEEQNKNMYSEEEVENILIEYVKTNPTKPYRVVSWFQQFKKK